MTYAHGETRDAPVRKRVRHGDGHGGRAGRRQRTHDRDPLLPANDCLVIRAAPTPRARSLSGTLAPGLDPCGSWRPNSKNNKSGRSGYCIEIDGCSEEPSMSSGRMMKIVPLVVLLTCLTGIGSVAALENVNPGHDESKESRSLSFADGPELMSDAGSTVSATGLPTPSASGTIPTPPPNGTNASGLSGLSPGAGSSFLIVSVSILGAVCAAGMLSRRRARDD